MLREAYKSQIQDNLQSEFCSKYASIRITLSTTSSVIYTDRDDNTNRLEMGNIWSENKSKQDHLRMNVALDQTIILG